MKIRNGFVSNSSSSSFLVKNWAVFDEEQLLSDEQIEKLIEYGFKPVDTYCTMSVECADWEMKSIATPEDSERPPLSYAYSVSCNQSDVTDWLVFNDIPFKGLCHYGHHSVIFDGKNIYTIPNYGVEAEMHGVEDLEYHFKKGPIRNFIQTVVWALMGRRIRERPLKPSIIKVESVDENKEKTQRIFNLPSEGA